MVEMDNVYVVTSSTDFRSPNNVDTMLEMSFANELVAKAPKLTGE